MTDNQVQDLSEVEGLLATRQQLTEWLEKLEAAASKTPPTVRARVRADYQGRLAQVVNQLRSHSDVISSTLQGLRAQASQFEQLRSEERETLAEAELRHLVGEYGEDEWERVERDATAKVSSYETELSRLGIEIARLEDVLAQIRPGGPLAVSPMATEEDNPLDLPPQLSLVKDDEPARAPLPEAPPPAPPEIPEAPRFVPRGGRGRESGPVRGMPVPPPAPEPLQPAASGAMDELAFLKSLEPAPPRASGSHGTVATSAPVEAKPAAERPSQTVPRTLKCGECGALNRPTEWYCERCGAELAAV